MKVVINTCFGGFGLSREATMRYAELAGFKLYAFKHEYVGTESKYTLLADGEEHDGLFTTYRKGPTVNSEFFSDSDLLRHDPLLVQVVEELGDMASGRFAQLKVIDIPDGTDYEIAEYDGNEHIAERHRTWA